MENTDDFTILCISHLEWTKTLFQRPQQVMLRLSERYNVIYFREWCLKEWIKGILNKKDMKSFKVNKNFFIFNPVMPLPTLKRKIKIFELLNRWLVTQSLKMTIKRNKIDKIILWFYFPNHLELISKIKAPIIVYECMDNHVALSHNDKSYAEYIKNKEVYLLDKADVIFYGSKTLMDSRPEYRHKSHHIPTGVDVKHFSKAMDNHLSLPDDIRCITKPILGYWGAVDERIDYKVLHYCATTHPEWSIVLLGPMVKIEQREINFFLNLPNVYLLGPKIYESLPDYARAFDVCLLPFKQTDEGKYLNPTKTLEYLATGKPIVSTKIPDIVQFYYDTVIIASDEKDFVEKLQKALLNDNEEKRNGRLSTTKGNSWESMVERMEQIVSKELDLIEKSHSSHHHGSCSQKTIQASGHLPLRDGNG